MYVLGMLYIAKLLVSLWVQTVRPLSRLCFCTAMREISSLESDTQSDIIEEFNNTSRYLVDIFNIDNPLASFLPIFDTLFSFIYPKELRLNKTNESSFSASFSGRFRFRNS